MEKIEINYKKLKELSLLAELLKSNIYFSLWSVEKTVQANITANGKSYMWREDTDLIEVFVKEKNSWKELQVIKLNKLIEKENLKKTYITKK